MSWADRGPGGETHAPNSFAQSRDWERASPHTHKLMQRYANGLNLPPNFIHIWIFPRRIIYCLLYYCIHRCRQPHNRLVWPREARSRGRRAFWSLTELKWGEFEEMGFGGLHPRRRYSSLTSRKDLGYKRTTLTWTNFSPRGFSRMDAPLSATLQFRAPFMKSLVFARETSRNYAQMKKDAEHPSAIWLGPGACHGHRGYHRRSLHGRVLRSRLRWWVNGHRTGRGRSRMQLSSGAQLLSPHQRLLQIEFQLFPLTRSTVSGGAERNHALPPPVSFSMSICCSNTASRSLQYPKQENYIKSWTMAVSTSL